LGKETENAEFHRGRSNIMTVGHLVALGGKKSKGKRDERKGNVFRVSIVFLLQKKTEAFVESSWTLGSYP